MSQPYRVFVAQSAAAREQFQIRPALEKLRSEVDLVLSPLEEGSLSAEQLADHLQEAEALITGWGGGKVPAQAYAKAKHLQHVALIGSSLANIAPESAWERGAVISNTAVAIGQSVAEFTVGVILTMVHRWHAFDAALKGGATWSEAHRVTTQTDLADHRVGIVGLGAVGRETVARLAPFGCEIVAFDPFLDDQRLATLGVTRAASLEELFGSCSVISLHAGLTAESRHMVNADLLSRMAPGTLLVNTARGGLIDEAALVALLQKGQHAAALDVYEKEPLAADHPLRSMPNVLITPHIGGYDNRSTYARCARTVVDDVLRVARGETPRNLVTPEMHSRAT